MYTFFDMHNKTENIPAADAAQTAPQNLDSNEAPLDVAAGMEKVKEIAKDKASQNMTGAKGDDDKKQTQHKQDDGLADDREMMKERLLKTAPPESAMKKQIEEVLLKRKDKLEYAVKKHKKRRNYHALSLAVMQLRIVVHQLEELAKASYEKAQELWLKFVHKFA
jgi:hypothetical protein